MCVIYNSANAEITELMEWRAAHHLHALAKSVFVGLPMHMPFACLVLRRNHNGGPRAFTFAPVIVFKVLFWVRASFFSLNCAHVTACMINCQPPQPNHNRAHTNPNKTETNDKQRDISDYTDYQIVRTAIFLLALSLYLPFFAHGFGP